MVLAAVLGDCNTRALTRLPGGAETLSMKASVQPSPTVQLFLVQLIVHDSSAGRILLLWLCRQIPVTGMYSPMLPTDPPRLAKSK